MEMKEPGEALNQNWLQRINKSSESVKEEEKKLQTTVRLESETHHRIEQISNGCGISFSEAVRRVLEDGLK